MVEEQQYFNYRANDHDTSIEAAESQTTAKLQNDRKKVLDAHLANPDGLNDYELSVITGLEKSTAAKRRLDLCRPPYELIEQTELRKPTNTGRSGIVWRLKK